MRYSKWSLSRMTAVSRMLVVVAACSVVSGCELGRSTFQMNSNSPMPFFGFDLLPRRKTTSIVSPQAGQQVASAESVPSGIETTSDTPSLRRFWQRNSKPVDRQQSSIVLPLSKPNPDQPIDRGPIELLP